VFAWGNPSRGDDALGPTFLARLAPWIGERGRGNTIELLTDFQLQPEHATDLDGRALALFVDASSSGPSPFSFTRVALRRDASFTSHALTPGALLAAFQQVFWRPAPPVYALAIRGERFELGEDISVNALRNLEAAIEFARRLLDTPSAETWHERAMCAR
jgi:hydrogenase maturation protease